MSSISPGFKSITLLQSILLQARQFRMDYGVASQYNIGRIYSHVSRAWQRPDLILPKLNVVLFLWFDAGSGGGEGAVSADVATRWRRWLARGAPENRGSSTSKISCRRQHMRCKTKLYETWANALAAGTATGTVTKILQRSARLHRAQADLIESRSPSGRARGSRSHLPAAHKYGITHVDYRVFPRNGVTKLASGVFKMKWNANGGLPTTNYDNAFQGISQAIRPQLGERSCSSPPTPAEGRRTPRWWRYDDFVPISHRNPGPAGKGERVLVRRRHGDRLD